MQETEDSILNQYILEFKLFNIEVEFLREAVEYVTEISEDRKTGARALMSDWENILTDFQFELPGSNFRTLEVTRELCERPKDFSLLRNGLKKGGTDMYALIYDEFDPAKREKKVISVHKTRETAEKAMIKRQRKLGQKVWESHARIVWVGNPVHKGDNITPNNFDTWAPGEKIPEGDQVPDGD